VAIAFTPERRATVIERTQAGDPIPRAAAAAGISGECVKKWLRIGRVEATGPRAEFARALLAAREVAHELAPPSETGEPMTDAEFRACLEVAVRRGAVSAMSLWSTLFLAPPELEQKPLSAIARLAQPSSVPDLAPPPPPPPRRVSELPPRRRVDVPQVYRRHDRDPAA
jgi:hypothetical protein